jgi:hypothetical protein
MLRSAALALLFAFPASALAAEPAGDSSTPSQSVGERDVIPTVEILRRENFSLYMGMLLQTQIAFYVGSQSAIQFDDPADQEGFRVRRARFGFSGRVLKDITYYIAIDLKDTVLAAFGGDKGPEILDASVVWDRFRAFRITVGLDKIPLSVYQLMSSSHLELIERPLYTNLLAPSRRVGATASGSIDIGPGQLRYAAGMYNGSEGVTSGNRLAGISAVGSLQYDIFRPAASFVPKSFGVSVGGAYMFDDGTAVKAHRASGNLQVQGAGVRLVAELLYEKSNPKDVPSTDPVAGEVVRKGVAADLSVFLWRPYLQFAFRYEYFFDNDALPTFGQQRLLSGGLNVYFYGDRFKLQINYIHRDEVSGPVVENDIFFAQLQVSF